MHTRVHVVRRARGGISAGAIRKPSTLCRHPRMTRSPPCPFVQDAACRKGASEKATNPGSDAHSGSTGVQRTGGGEARARKHEEILRARRLILRLHLHPTPTNYAAWAIGRSRYGRRADVGCASAFFMEYTASPAGGASFALDEGRKEPERFAGEMLIRRRTRTPNRPIPSEATRVEMAWTRTGRHAAHCVK
ncbi:hypothetical protein B0H13DRAFT_1856044 [Mycena leptocephala]|nr:hypothetical protein B0H13DRAFT_1856044 [Mycena leptocephala]